VDVDVDLDVDAEAEADVDFDEDAPVRAVLGEALIWDVRVKADVDVD